jgi:hypothetical protein
MPLPQFPGGGQLLAEGAFVAEFGGALLVLGGLPEVPAVRLVGFLVLAAVVGEQDLPQLRRGGLGELGNLSVDGRWSVCPVAAAVSCLACARSSRRSLRGT